MTGVVPVRYLRSHKRKFQPGDPWYKSIRASR